MFSLSTCYTLAKVNILWSHQHLLPASHKHAISSTNTPPLTPCCPSSPESCLFSGLNFALMSLWKALLTPLPELSALLPVGSYKPLCLVLTDLITPYGNCLFNGLSPNCGLHVIMIKYWSPSTCLTCSRHLINSWWKEEYKNE